jgi:hypothetical protein
MRVSFFVAITLLLLSLYAGFTVNYVKMVDKAIAVGK